MKVMLMLMAILVWSATWAEEFDTKSFLAQIKSLSGNRKTLDQTKVKTALAYVESTTCKNDQEKYDLLKLYGNAVGQRTDVTTVAQYLELMDAKEKSLGFETALNTVQKLTVRNAWWRAHNEKIAEHVAWGQGMYDYMKTLEGYQNFTSAGKYANLLGRKTEAYNLYMTSGYFYDRAMRIASEDLNDPNKALDALKAFTQLDSKNAQDAKIVDTCVNYTRKYLMASDVDAEELKATLTKLNRKYSGMLVSDKATWEPIIAKIRLMLSSL